MKRSVWWLSASVVVTKNPGVCPQRRIEFCGHDLFEGPQRGRTFREALQSLSRALAMVILLVPQPEWLRPPFLGTSGSQVARDRRQHDRVRLFTWLGANGDRTVAKDWTLTCTNLASQSRAGDGNRTRVLSLGS